MITIKLDIAPIFSNAISAIAGFLVLYSYFSLHRKPASLKMIIILSASDLIFHLMLIFKILNLDPYLISTGDTIASMTIDFSMLWAANIAIFLCKSLVEQDQPNAEKWITISFIILFLLCLPLTFMRFILSTYVFWLLCFIICIITLMATLIFYSKAIAHLVNLQIQFQFWVRPAVKLMYLYGFAQLYSCGLITLHAGAFAFFDNDPNDRYETTLWAVWAFLLGFTGFINALIYFLGPRRYIDLNRPSSEMNSQDNSIGFVSL